MSPNTSPREMTVTIIRAMANLPTAHTLMSVVSWRIRGFRGCLISSMFQNLLEVRGIPGHQRTLLQLGEKVGQPETGQSDRKGEIQEADPEALRAETRRDQPVEIHQPHRQNKH